jgi:hypothetical protein
VTGSSLHVLECITMNSAERLIPGTPDEALACRRWIHELNSQYRELGFALEPALNRSDLKTPTVRDCMLRQLRFVIDRVLDSLGEWQTHRRCVSEAVREWVDPVMEEARQSLERLRTTPDLEVASDAGLARSAAGVILRRLEELVILCLSRSGHEYRLTTGRNPKELHAGKATAQTHGPDAPPVPPTTGAVPCSSNLQLEVGNLFRLIGEVWHVRYVENGEVGNFQDRSDSALRHLARLLAEPNRRFRAPDFYPPPPGAVPPPHFGRDASSDDQSLKECEAELTDLVREIKEADDAHDAETAAALRDKFKALTDYLEGEKAARNLGHKKRCGTLSPAEKADQALRMGLERAKDRFRRQKMPKLADHLEKYLSNEDGEWWYAPPPETSPWQVILPDPSAKNSRRP